MARKKNTKERQYQIVAQATFVVTANTLKEGQEDVRTSLEELNTTEVKILGGQMMVPQIEVKEENNEKET